MISMHMLYHTMKGKYQFAANIVRYPPNIIKIGQHLTYCVPFLKPGVYRKAA